MKKLQKGFTLIELLVVIAIIGILSSVVLASLSSARTRGTDAAVQADLANMRAQAELYNTANNSFGTSSTDGTAGSHAYCGTANTVFTATTTGIRNALVGVAAKTGGTNAIGTAASRVACAANTVSSTQTTFAVMASTSDATRSWCVDSAGASKFSTAFVGGLCN
jgi:prepilin-type N-terminal cleavage/methylation domain-containing protein